MANQHRLKLAYFSFPVNISLLLLLLCCVQSLVYRNVTLSDSHTHEDLGEDDKAEVSS